MDHLTVSPCTALGHIAAGSGSHPLTLLNYVPVEESDSCDYLWAEFPPAFATSTAFGLHDSQVLLAMVHKKPELDNPPCTFLPCKPYISLIINIITYQKTNICVNDSGDDHKK